MDRAAVPILMEEYLPEEIGRSYFEEILISTDGAAVPILMECYIFTKESAAPIIMEYLRLPP
jgi:5-methylthioribose kinase